MHLTRFLPLAVAISLLAFGCAPAHDGSGSQTAVPLTITPTVAVATTSTPELPSPSPSATQLPTLSPSSTIVQRPTAPTATPVATLTRPNQETYLLDLVTTNKNCELPCWWGLRPGQSSFAEVLALFGPLGQSGLARPASDGLIRYDFGLSVNQLNLLNLAVAFLEQDGLVRGIEVQATPTSSFPRLSQALHRYSLDNLLKDYGQPSQVLVGLTSGKAEAQSPYVYHLWVLYGERGVALYYGGQTELADTVQICPQYDKLRDMRFYMKSPGSNTTLSNEADIALNLRDGYLQPLEKATGISVPAFTELVRAKGEHACLQSPRNIWP